MSCHVRLMNSQNRNAERINKQDKKITANSNYSDIVFPLDINDYEKIEDFNRLMFSRTKHKDKKRYCMSSLQNFTAEEILSNHKKTMFIN